MICATVCTQLTFATVPKHETLCPLTKSDFVMDKGMQWKLTKWHSRIDSMLNSIKIKTMTLQLLDFGYGEHAHDHTSAREHTYTTSSREIPVGNSGKKARPLVLLAQASVLTPSLALLYFGDNLQLCLSHNQSADRRRAALHCRNASLMSSHL